MLRLNTIECMDCLEYLRQLPDACVDLVITDPPYNVSQKSNPKFRGRTITKNFGDWDFNFDAIPILNELKRVLKPHGQIYIFCSTKQLPMYMQIFAERWFFRNILVWCKRNPIPSFHKRNYIFANEYVVYAVNCDKSFRGATFNFSGQSSMHNTFTTPVLQGKERLRNADKKALHPTQKPVAILKKLVEVSSNPGDIVLDPFMGVGSTAVAAFMCGRRFIGCDMNISYVTAALQRMREIN